MDDVPDWMNLQKRGGFAYYPRTNNIMHKVSKRATFVRYYEARTCQLSYYFCAKEGVPGCMCDEQIRWVVVHISDVAMRQG